MIPRSQLYEFEALFELLEFAVPKTVAGNLKLLNAIGDRIKSLGYGSKNKVKRQMLTNWKWQVNSRFHKMSPQRPRTPGDGNFTPKRLVRTKKDYIHTRREHKLNKMSGHEPRTMSEGKRNKFLANKDKLLRQLGWT